MVYLASLLLRRVPEAEEGDGVANRVESGT
jgi:hypothetical protein